MVRPVEGPGGPLEGPGGPAAAGQDIFTTLPPEALQNMMQYLEPETLSTLRGTSQELQAQVDDYLEHLIDSGKLTDREGIPVRSGVLEPSEVLQNWGNNYLRIDYQPLSEADVAAIVKSWDEHLGTFGGPEEGTPLSLGWYEPVLNQGGSGAQRLQDELDYYVQSLLIEGRIVDANTNTPLPTHTSLREVMEQLRSGNATWLPPN